MRIGVGLPTSTPPVAGRHRGAELVAWAARADAGPFTSLGVVDRLVYDCTDPLVALAAAAAVTSRIRLVTMVVIGPIWPAALLAAQAASLDALSGGRLTLGVSLGARPDDYDVAGADWKSRGPHLSDELAAIREIWDGTAVGPRPVRPGGPDLLVGGASRAAFLRAARHGDGYVHGGGPPRAFAGAAERVRAAWADVGRPGEPQLWGQSYFSLADPAAAAAYMRDYYAFTGPFAERVVAGLLDSPKAVREQVAGYAEAGCDELVLLPATSDPSELDRLADLIG
jgi:alkanesulfonate monooxygenase SsuD/methylene tetrahydromethanopterin reductase-like flavin-dependent oxidoreductase (luciferase family)